MLASIVVWLVVVTIGSVVWDFMTYEQRQFEWEKAHPGATYQPGYPRKMRKAQRARRRQRNEKGVI